ncbi:hypothetical protein CLOM_g5702 [Closterium sp. NIES-68]|nr:hypothetical protein CLOM_g5702 [Closterium sp. NIES-68]GJP64059.1 hypothetical protein CLOP_g21090 [Closterium sp. NIES-67]
MTPSTWISPRGLETDGGDRITAVHVAWRIAVALLLVLAAGPLRSDGAARGAASEPRAATLVLLTDNKFGARCLDGSPPGYYLRAAPWEGITTWHIHFPGGGWCATKRECGWRAGRLLGGTTMWPPTNNVTWAQNRFGGILSSSGEANPFFAQWHLAMPVYCDGGGYAGTAGQVAVGKGRVVYMDGSRIVGAILEDLLTNRALSTATTVLISGTSAGGLPVMRLCDALAALLPRASVKCLLDGAFFPVTPASERWRCFFPQYALPLASSPFFIVNPAFDKVSLLIGNQLPNITNPVACLKRIVRSQTNLLASLQSRLFRPVPEGQAGWCTERECSAAQSTAASVYSSILSIVQSKKGFGAFVPVGLVAHSTITSPLWNSMKVAGTPMLLAVARWVASGNTGHPLLYT